MIVLAIKVYQALAFAKFIRCYVAEWLCAESSHYQESSLMAFFVGVLEGGRVCKCFMRASITYLKYDHLAIGRYGKK